MRPVRKAIEVALPAAGTVLVFGAILFLWQSLVLQVFVVLVGLVLVQGGTWRLARPVLADDRRYLALRAEVDDFIRLVRRLNAAAVARPHDPGAAAEFDAVQAEMAASLARIGDAAGVERRVSRAPAR